MNKSLMSTQLLAGICALALVAGAVQAGPSGLKVINQIKIGGTDGWDYVTVDSPHHRLYVAHKTSIAAVDLSSGAVTAHFADADGAHIALPVLDGAEVMITHGKADHVTLNDAASGAVLATIATDAKPDAAIVEPVTGRVFIMANGGNAVDVLDLASKSIVAHIPVGGAAEAAAVDGAGLVFTHLEDANKLVVIDAQTLKVKASYAMDDCTEPSGVAFVPAGRLVVSACKNGVARISNADTGAEVASVPIGQGPDGALYDAANGLAYIPTRDGNLSVIGFDGGPHLVENVATKVGARTAALDSATGDVYLPTADFGPPATAGDRPAILPDTFEIVVVGR